MIQQFFGKEYWFMLALSAALFGDAIVSYAFEIGWIMLSLYFVAVFVLAYKRLDLAIVLVFLELFTNSHGKLIFTDIAGVTVSLRMTLFAAILLAWGLLLVQKKVRIDVARMRPFLVLFVGIALGLTGILLNPPIDAFQDGNAYLYLLYLGPILSIVWTPERKRLLLQALAAGATWIVVLSFVALYLYTHFSERQLEPIYLFLRDVRLAEITFVTASLYRVFIQSQFFVIVLAMMWLALFFEQTGRRVSWQLVAFLAPAVSIVLMSLSRSFWFGIVFALATVVVLSLVKLKPNLKRVGAVCVKGGSAVILGGVLLGFVVLFPFPSRSYVDLSDALKERTGSDVAISSRWKLLDPMLQTIAQSPLLGSGFGKTVTFQTDDPRVRSIHPDGSWTTYSMEWGWLELWLKMGIFGPLGFLVVAVALVRGFLAQIDTDQRWLAIGFLGSLMFLYVTHTFSPYLNHPIGLGFLLFAFIFTDGFVVSRVSVFDAIKTSIERKPAPTPVLTSQQK